MPPRYARRVVDQEELSRAVSAVVNDCLGVREGENVLVIANPATLGLGERLRGEAGRAGADAVLALMAERASHAGEPPAPVAAAMKAADVVLAPTVQSLSHTASRKAASEAGARIATLPGVTEEMLARVMSADMAELRRRGHAIADALNGGSEARITCPDGSDLRLGLEGRTAIPDAGELTERAAFGNLPCGEAFISPDDRACEGTLVVDGTIAGVGLPEEPVRLVVEGGRLVSASGPEGAALMELLTVHGPEATTIAELGIGTNEKAKLTGFVLEDEKLLGTAHVAFGASEAIGGRIQVPVHLDCVVMRPTVTVDGAEIVRDGELLL
jgi:leucyl aminopeptidase (aminopeptidase T)